MGAPNTRSRTCKIPPPWPLHASSWQRWGKTGQAEPERDELHFPDETHLETNPYLCRVGPRQGKPPTLPGVGTNRRVTVGGRVEGRGRTRIELVRAAQDTAGFVR